jgi:hypothetical protein
VQHLWHYTALGTSEIRDWARCFKY